MIQQMQHNSICPPVSSYTYSKCQTHDSRQANCSNAKSAKSNWRRKRCRTTAWARAVTFFTQSLAGFCSFAASARSLRCSAARTLWRIVAAVAVGGRRPQTLGVTARTVARLSVRYCRCARASPNSAATKRCRDLCQRSAAKRRIGPKRKRECCARAHSDF